MNSSGCQLDDTVSQILPEWPQICKSDVLTCKNKQISATWLPKFAKPEHTIVELIPTNEYLLKTQSSKYMKVRMLLQKVINPIIICGKLRLG